MLFKGIGKAGLYLLLTASGAAVAAEPECTAVFPDGVQNNSPSGDITFGSGAQIIGNPDLQLATSNPISDSSGGNSCETASCESKGETAEGLSFNGFGGRNKNYVTVGAGGSMSITPGYYEDITLGAGATLKLSRGDYILRGNLSLGSASSIELSSSASSIELSSSAVGIYVKDTILMGAQAEINTDGDPSELLIYNHKGIFVGDEGEVNAFIYGKEDFTLGKKGVVRGGVNAKDITLEEDSTVYVQTSEQAKADFDGVCEQGEVAVDISSLQLTAAATGLTCEALAITLTAYDGSGAEVIPTAGTLVDLSSNGVGGSWSLASGSFSPITQTSFDGSSSTLSLAFLPSSAATLSLSATLNSNGAVLDSASVAFSDAALQFYSAKDGAKSTLLSQIANKPDTLWLRAIKTDPASGECVAALQGASSVTFGLNCTSPGSCQVKPSIAGATLPDDGVVSMGFDSDGWASFGYNYADAGRVELSASTTVSAEGQQNVTISGTSNEFVSVPAGLCVEAVDTAASCSDATDLASCSLYKAAGETFAIKVSGRAWQSDTESNAEFCSGNGITQNFQLSNIPLTHTLVAPSGGGAGTLSRTSGTNQISISSNGEAQLSDLKLSEVGVFSLTATAPSYLGETIAASTSANIGRFNPASFSLGGTTGVAEACGPSGKEFSYMGQPFSLTADLQPLNAAGDAVSNYSGIFDRLVGGSLSYGAAQGATDFSGRIPGGLVLTGSHVTAGAVTVPMTIARGGSPDGPFSSLAIGVSIADLDGVALSHDLDTDGDTVSDKARVDSTELLYGRLNIGAASAQPDSALPVEITTQYWDGSAFTTLEQGKDNCTSVQASHFSASVVDDATGTTAAYSDVTANITLGSGSTTGALAGTLNDPDSGSPLQLSFSAPGDGNTGTLTLTLDAASHYSWLQDESGSNPAADASFSNAATVPASDRVIYWLDN